MKYILLTDRLQFVSLGTGKIHARDMEVRATLPQKITMCGKDIYASAEVRPQRALSESVLCGRCVASLRTYTGRMGATAHVQVESETGA